MSTSDGTIRFDTEINNSKLTKEISSMTKNFEAFAKTGGQSFDKVDKAAESTAETMGEVAKSIDQLQSGDMEKLQNSGITSMHRSKSRKNSWMPCRKNMSEFPI